MVNFRSKIFTIIDTTWTAGKVFEDTFIWEISKNFQKFYVKKSKNFVLKNKKFCVKTYKKFVLKNPKILC